MNNIIKAEKNNVSYYCLKIALRYYGNFSCTSLFKSILTGTILKGHTTARSVFILTLRSDEAASNKAIWTYSKANTQLSTKLEGHSIFFLNSTIKTTYFHAMNVSSSKIFKCVFISVKSLIPT